MNCTSPEQIQLRLPHWEVKEVKVINSKYLFTVEYNNKLKPEICPKCASTNLVRNGPRTVTFFDKPYNRIPTCLRIRRQRYLCRECGNSFKQELPDISEKRLATNRFVEYVEAECQEKGPRLVSRSSGASINTIRNIFLEHTSKIEADCPALYNRPYAE